MSAINVQVSLLIARELLEACLFITSYFGAVAKSPFLNPEEKRGYYTFLVGGLGVALICGLIVSSIIGVALSKAVDAIDTVAFAVELGEGLSKLIAAWFVSGMLFKVPMWFDISNYKDTKKSSKFANASNMGSKWSFCSMLFWNTFREFTEAGTITSTIVLLSPTGMATLGASVGFGIALAGIIGIIFFLGARYASVRLFGILGTCLAGVLTIGLISGAVHSLAEAYADSQGTENYSGLVYEVTDENLGSIFAAFEFMGLSDYHTRLSFSVWTIAMALVPYSVYRHHYLGKPTLIQSLKNLCFKKKHKRGHSDEGVITVEESEEKEEEEEDSEGDKHKPKATKVSGGKKLKNVDVEFSLPSSALAAGGEGDVAVKMQLAFPEANFPEGEPAVFVEKVGGVSLPVRSVELVGGHRS